MQQDKTDGQKSKESLENDLVQTQVYGPSSGRFINKARIKKLEGKSDCCNRFDALKNLFHPWQRASLEYLARVGSSRIITPFDLENVLEEFGGSIFRTNRAGLEFLDLLFRDEIIIPREKGKYKFSVSPDYETRNLLAGFLPAGKQLKILVDCDVEYYPYTVKIKLATDLKMKDDVLSIDKRNYYYSGYRYGLGDEMVIEVTGNGKKPVPITHEIKNNSDDDYYRIVISRDNIIS
jgi:hypothetical protein